MNTPNSYPGYLIGGSSAIDQTQSIASIVGIFYKDLMLKSGSEELALALSRDLGQDLIKYWIQQG